MAQSESLEKSLQKMEQEEKALEEGLNKHTELHKVALDAVNELQARLDATDGDLSLATAGG